MKVFNPKGCCRHDVRLTFSVRRTGELLVSPVSGDFSAYESMSMTVEAFDWNVVVAGHWNPAILTPSGIGQRLFGLKPGTPIRIDVSTDGLAPYRVTHDELTVTAETERLAVYAETPRYPLLDRAREVAAKAIVELPETPLMAAGFNVRLRIADPPDVLLEATKCQIDNLLSDAGFSIGSRVLVRSMTIDDGMLNLSINEGNEITAVFNFHRQSSKRDELVAWLKYPIDKVEKIVSSVMESVIRVPMGEIGK